MAEIPGVYAHVRSENTDEYFKAIGVPWIGRKMMANSNPQLEVAKDDEKWTIRNVTMMRTSELNFALGVEYEESMPSGDRLKNVTNLEGNSLITTSKVPNGSKIVRKYDFTNDGAVLTMTHEDSGIVAKRFYNRIAAK